MIGRALAVWLMLLVLAVVNGGVRETIVTPRLGAYAGHVISTLVLCALVVLLARLAIGWISPASAREAFVIGVVWVMLTLAFELLAGHYLFGTSWDRLLADYNMLRGRIWPLVPLTVLLAPLIGYRLAVAT